MAKFNLFAGSVQEIPSDVKYYLYRESAGYILAYAPVESLEGFLLVSESEVKLTKDERVWLASCKLQENTEAIKEGDYLDLLEAFLDDLEKQIGCDTNG